MGTWGIVNIDILIPFRMMWINIKEFLCFESDSFILSTTREIIEI